jgi:hypothetical protein
VYQRKSSSVQQNEKSKVEKDIVKDGILEDVGRTIKLVCMYVYMHTYRYTYVGCVRLLVRTILFWLGPVRS